MITSISKLQLGFHLLLISFSLIHVYYYLLLYFTGLQVVEPWFWANFLRLFISSLAYEMFLLLKEAIKKTGFELPKKWQIATIRVALLKIGATIKITKRRVYYRYSKAFVH